MNQTHSSFLNVCECSPLNAEELTSLGERRWSLHMVQLQYRSTHVKRRIVGIRQLESRRAAIVQSVGWNNKIEILRQQLVPRNYLEKPLWLAFSTANCRWSAESPLFLRLSKFYVSVPQSLLVQFLILIPTQIPEVWVWAPDHVHDKNTYTKSWWLYFFQDVLQCSIVCVHIYAKKMRQHFVLYYDNKVTRVDIWLASFWCSWNHSRVNSA